MRKRLTHLDERGAARMVDVSAKERTDRRARAEARVRVRPATLRAIRAGSVTKGGVLEVARLAGIQAAKRTADWIPLCHPLALSSVRVDLECRGTSEVRIETEVRATDRTGVEMEALTAAAAAALTVYDMVKAIDRGVVIGPLRLLEKEGGKSGPWRAPALAGAANSSVRSPAQRTGGGGSGSARTRRSR